MSGVVPFPYQAEAIKCLFEAYERGVKSAMIVMATGLGKTFCFSLISQRWASYRGGMVLVVADREELIWQAAEELERVTGVRPAVEMAGYEADLTRRSLWDSPVVVASKDSLHARRIGKFRPHDFGLVIFDECDLAARKCKSWFRVLEHFYQNPQCRYLGLTATPERADKQKLPFEEIVFSYPLVDAIRDGYLVFPRQVYLEVKGLDFNSLDLKGGDYDDAQIAEQLDEERTAHAIVYPALERVGTGLTLVVSPTVPHAVMTAAIFNDHRRGSAVALHGDSFDKRRNVKIVGVGKDQRREIVRAFDREEFQFLCVCGIGTRGFNQPKIKNIVNGRPTRSRTMYGQTIGRATRVWPDVPKNLATAEERLAAIAASPKPHALVIDPVGNASRMKAPLSTADVLGGQYPPDVVEAAVRSARERPNQPADMFAELEEAALFAQEKTWSRRSRLVIGVDYRAKEVDYFDASDTAAEGAAAARQEERATKKQVGFLTFLGMRKADARLLTKQQARREITKRKAMAGGRR